MNFAFILNILAVKTPSLAKEVAHDTANLKAEVSKIPDALQSLINWSIESGKHIAPGSIRRRAFHTDVADTCLPADALNRNAPNPV